MKLAYFSVTGQTRRFVSKTNLPNVEISPDDDIEMNEPFLLITPSYAEESPTVSKSIDVMDPVFDFMAYNDNYKHCLGIIGTGNRNFAGIYIFTAKELSAKYQIPLLYDFDLMMGGGHLCGYLLGKEEKKRIEKALTFLADPKCFADKYHVKDRPVLLFAVGDGNHSLAAAKAYYEQLKAAHPDEDLSEHPARYALVEVVNLHSPALQFEAIHRIVTDVHVEDLLSKMNAALHIKKEGKGQTFYTIYNGKKKRCVIERPTSKLTVGSLQRFLDGYLAQNGGKIDYIHGEEVVESLAREKDSIGFILPDMGKEELFPTVIHDGALPRKTFSMGHAQDKRYYTECRKIRK